MTDTKNLIEEARRFESIEASLFPKDTERAMRRLADALEAAEQRAENAEHQVQIRAEDSIAARVARQNVRAVEEWARVNQERDALAAVVGKVREARATHPECEKHAGDDAVSCGWKSAVLDIDDALATAPADALREHDARVWDECVEDAEGRGWLHDYAVSDMTARNPHRKAQS